MTTQTVEYSKGAHRASATVISTGDGRFRGSVDLSHGDSDALVEHHLVPVSSDTPAEALDEAKALAHRLMSNLQ